jgi:acetoin utilization deacetylase AcuC-like enzyme
MMDRVILPRLRAFRPDLLFISAGFDAHRDDPLASLALTDADFGAITARLVAFARESCQGRIVSALEGGYDLAGLATSARAHVQALMEDT